FGPEKGYGNATHIQTQPREETRDRNFSLAVRTESVGVGAFAGYINQTQQGDPGAYKVGDVFHFVQGANTWPYRIVSRNETSVSYRLNAAAGESYTLYPLWPNASRVAGVNDTAILFVTTPPTAP